MFRISVHVVVFGAAILVLAGCGATGRTASVTVVSQGNEPVDNAAVAVSQPRERTTTNADGIASLSRLVRGSDQITITARGYFSSVARLPANTRSFSVDLRYRPPDGTFVWNIGPNGEFWDQGTVTASAIRATEYDWSCHRNPHSGKEVGAWVAFPGPLPEAVAPDVLGPEWVRRHFPAGGPPVPALGCRTPAGKNHAQSPPWWG